MKPKWQITNSYTHLFIILLPFIHHQFLFLNNKVLNSSIVSFSSVEKNDDDTVPNIFEKVAKELGVEPEISSFHAGAETHIYANRTNAKGEKFSPYLIGLATVCNMHSAREYVDYKTMIKGQELLKAFFEAFNK